MDRIGEQWLDSLFRVPAGWKTGAVGGLLSVDKDMGRGCDVLSDVMNLMVVASSIET